MFRSVLSTRARSSISRHFTTRARAGRFNMDISSGNVSFGPLCPGTVMQELVRDKLDQVKKITKFQTALSSSEIVYQCPLPCKDLSIVHNFVKSIDALEELSILNYEPDASAIWPAILYHDKSLRSLAIHTPPQESSETWTPETVSALASGLPNLRHLELDISLGTALDFLETSDPPHPTSVIGAATTLKELESILMNIKLDDAGSSFAGKHTWDVMGCIEFPDPDKQACERLVRKLVDYFPARVKKVQIRLARRCWDDRFQFSTLGYSTTATRDGEGKVAVEADKRWDSYLPPWPAFDGLLWRLMEEYRNEKRV